MSDMQALPKDDPRIVAWQAYRLTEDYENTRRWALQEAHVDGSLWAAFIVGYTATRTSDTERLVEQVFAEDIIKQATRLQCLKSAVEHIGDWRERVRKTALLKALATIRNTDRGEG